MTLEEKLKKFKDFEEHKTAEDWETYKDEWKKSIQELEQKIIYKWFSDFDKKGLMKFDLVPVKRFEPYVGEYLTSNLEITLSNGKSFVLEPVSAITSEYDGKIEFYLRGNIDKSVAIVRESNDEGDKWFIIDNISLGSQQILEKKNLEQIMNQWL